MLASSHSSLCAASFVSLRCTSTFRRTADNKRYLLRLGRHHGTTNGRRCQSTTSTTTAATTASAAKSTKQETRQSWFAWYSEKLETHPLPTMMVTSGLLAGGGDVLCQSGIEHTQPYDVMRTARFTLLGTVVVAPFVHAWYSLLNRFVPGKHVRAVVIRVALDQLTFSPAFVAFWLSCLWGLEGERDPNVVTNRLQGSLPAVVVANWSLWVPAQIINFRLVPGKFQVGFSNITALVWNVYLSFTQTRKQEHEDEEEQERQEEETK